MYKTKDILLTGFALFAMLFGAGNLIFPPMLGYETSSSWLLTMLAFIKGEDVGEIISRRMWVSVRLVFLGSFVGMGLGTALGAWTATKQYSISDRVATFLSLVVISTPVMVLALFLKLGAIEANQALGG